MTRRFFHGGKFGKTRVGLEYLGGQIRTFSDVYDELSGIWLKQLAVKCGGYNLEEVKCIYYLSPGKKLENGLSTVYIDSKVLAMVDCVKKVRSVDLYVLHSGDSPEALLLQSSLRKPNTQKAHRPNKLTPKKCGQQSSPPLRRSPRLKDSVKVGDPSSNSFVPKSLDHHLLSTSPTSHESFLNLNSQHVLHIENN